jgi:hypothetical protein
MYFVRTFSPTEQEIEVKRLVFNAWKAGRRFEASSRNPDEIDR